MFHKKRTHKKENRLFGNSIEPSCAYCSHSTDETCAASGTPCGRFLYDPLLRTPDGEPPLKEHDPEEYSL